MPVQTQLQQRRGTAASWTSTNPTLAAGEIGFETDTGKFKIGNGSTAWAALAYSAGATAVTYLFNATSGQTTFSGADANGLTLAYTVGAEQVYLNGVLQVRGSDYTATNGTSIVLTSGALTSDVLNVIAYSAMTITDTYTQAQADAKFFQTANAFLAGKNKIINGDFGIWQRGTSLTDPAGSTYLADRWRTSYQGIPPTSRTYSQQSFTLGAAPVAGYESKFFGRLAITTKGSNVRAGLANILEDARTFAGQTVTFSFWAKSDAARTGSIIVTQQYGDGGSPSTALTVVDTSISLTTSWQRFSHTFSMPSVSGKTFGTNNNSYLAFEVNHNTADGSYIDLWGGQVEAGSIATPFQTATGTIAGELAACQRYYTRFTGAASTAVLAINGFAASTTIAIFNLMFPVQMRSAPTALDSNNLAFYNFRTAATLSGGTFVRWQGYPSTIQLRYTHGSAVFAINDQIDIVGAAAADTYIGLSAEL